MMMVIDIGNTNIVVGLFHDDDFLLDWRLYTDTRRTDDEYNSILRSLFRDSGIAPGIIEQTIISSVVPLLNDTFLHMIEKLTGKVPIIIGPELYDRLPVKVPETAIHEIGTDIVCDAVAAYTQYKSACIIIGFGTALTFTAVNDAGEIQGVAIAPGLGTAVKALFRDTAQLQSVPLEAPPSIMATNTMHSIQAGVVLGYKGLVESIVAQMRKELGCNALAIATGGLSYVLAEITDVFDKVDQKLTLQGLKLIAGMVTDFPK